MNHSFTLGRQKIVLKKGFDRFDDNFGFTNSLLVKKNHNANRHFAAKSCGVKTDPKKIENGFSNSAGNP